MRSWVGLYKTLHIAAPQLALTLALFEEAIKGKASNDPFEWTYTLETALKKFIKGVWYTGCMTCRLYGMQAVWHAGCMTCRLYDLQTTCSVDCLACRLYDKIVVNF